MPYIQQVLQQVNYIEPNSGRRPALVRIIKTPMKLASVLLRISFLLSCRNAGVLPNFILNATVGVSKIFAGKPVILKECAIFRKKLLNESIRDAFKTKAFLERCQRRDHMELSNCSQPLYLWVKKACKSVFEDTLSTGRRRLKNKFDRLMAEQLKTADRTTSIGEENGEETRATLGQARVKNLSSQPISETMLSLLSKGPKFALTPKINSNLLLDVETGIERFAYGKRWKDFVDRKREFTNQNLNINGSMERKQLPERPHLTVQPVEGQATDTGVEQRPTPCRMVTRSRSGREPRDSVEPNGATLPLPASQADTDRTNNPGSGSKQPANSQQPDANNTSAQVEQQPAEPSNRRIRVNFPDVVRRQPPRSSPDTETKLSHLKKKIMNAYKNYTPSNMNTNDEERQELRTLKQSDSLIVKPSDKCKGLVVLDKREYIEKAEVILQDANNYEKLDKNPTAKIEAKTKQIFRQTCRDKLPESLLKDLTPAHSRTPVLYGLPKDHKENVPLRPIVSACGGPTEKTAWLLDRILTQLLTYVPAHLRNTEDYLNRMKTRYPEYQLPQNAIVFSMDVVNLYGSIPIDEAVEAVKDLVREHENDIDLFDLSPNDIARLLTHCLDSNCFRFDQAFYKQRLGIAMGCKVAPPVAIIFMHKLEQSALQNAEIRPDIYARYIDDTIGVWTHSHQELQRFLNYMNSVHPSIKFTMDDSHSTGSISYLDTLISIGSDGKYSTELFIKPNHSGIVIHYSSSQPMVTKKSVIRNEFKRAQKLSSDEQATARSCNKIQNIFECNGYPKQMIRRLRREASSQHPQQRRYQRSHQSRHPEHQQHRHQQQQRQRRQPSQEQQQPSQERRQQQTSLGPQRQQRHQQKQQQGHQRREQQERNVDGFLSLPYVDETLCAKINTIARNSNLDIKVAWTSKNTLKNTLVKSDLTRPECPSGRRVCNACRSGVEGKCTVSGVVYCITCNLCSSAAEPVTYIGECKRPIRSRFNEHNLNAKNASRDTPLGEHFRAYHTDDILPDYPLSVKILHKAKDHANRKIMESLYIRELKPVLNRNVSSWYVL